MAAQLVQAAGQVRTTDAQAACPQPPSSAPARMDRQNCDSLAPGSLTKYGISTAAFVAAAVKLNAQDPTAAAVAEKLPLDGCRGTSLVKMLASAAAIGRAELR